MLVQVAVLVLGVWKLNEKFYFVYGLLTLLDIILVIYINNCDDNPSYKLSWIMLISVIPVFGGLTYLYLKIQFSRKIFIKAQERSTEYGNNYLRQSEDTELLLEYEDKGMYNLSRYIQNVSAYPVYNNTKVKYYSVGELQFEDIVSELKKAEKFIFTASIDETRVFPTPPLPLTIPITLPILLNLFGFSIKLLDSQLPAEEQLEQS
jgi:cardiolipin synthase A/B